MQENAVDKKTRFDFIVKKWESKNIFFSVLLKKFKLKNRIKKNTIQITKGLGGG